MALNHVVMIRCAYPDGEMSAARLALTRLTLLPSLAAQSCKGAQVILRQDPADPMKAARTRAFEGAGFDVSNVHEFPTLPTNHSPENLAPDGQPRWLASRVDDDDIIATWFIESIQERAVQWAGDDCTLTFPNGLVFLDGHHRQFALRENMFLTLLAKRGHPYEFNHRRVADHFPLVDIRARRGWCWNRHTCNISPAKDYLSRFPIEPAAKVNQFAAVDWEAVQRFHWVPATQGS